MNTSKKWLQALQLRAISFLVLWSLPQSNSHNEGNINLRTRGALHVCRIVLYCSFAFLACANEILPSCALVRIFFTFFYTSITFNPTETADNLRKYGGFIPGIRPGESTALYIENILTKLTTIGALYLTLVCLMPEFLIANYPIPFYLGGTSILIVVVVAIDTVTQIQTRLMSSQYEQLIKKTKFGR